MTEPLIEVHNLAGNDDLCQIAAQLWPSGAPNRVDSNRRDNLREVASQEQLLAAVNARACLAGRSTGQPTLALCYIVHSDARALRDHGSYGDAYFQDALLWLEQRHGGDNIVAACIVRAQPSPRLEVIAVPLLPVTAASKKRAHGTGPASIWRLSATVFLGSKAGQRLVREFNAAVAGPHGFLDATEAAVDSLFGSGGTPAFDLDAGAAAVASPVAAPAGEVERLKLELEWVRDEWHRAESAQGEQLEILSRKLAEQNQEIRRLAGLLGCLSGEELAALAKRRRLRDLEKLRPAPTAIADIVHVADEDVETPPADQTVDDQDDDWFD